MEKMASARREEILWEEDEEKRRKEKEQDFSPQTVRYLGLCLTCNHALTCTFARKPDSPVLYCEEFDISAPPHPRLIRPAASPPARDDRGPAEGLLGLCSNCGNRGTCALPKAEGGVWHCEEYI